jgi:hypothetical protein
MRHLRFAALCDSLLALGACSSEPNCLQGSEYAVAIDVVAGESGSSLDNVKGEVRAGTYRDSLQATEIPGLYYAAENRDGVYAVHVERAGYASWDTTGVEAPRVAGDCGGVVGQHFTVTLTPSP